MLHGGQGKVDYLSLNLKNDWTQITRLAKRVVLRSAFIRYPLAEGIDVHKGKKLYMTCKREKMLYILDLDSNKYVRYSLEIALFEKNQMEPQHF
jgi:hypothetical protein